MSGLEVVLALAGLVVTGLVVAAMILLAPRGEVDLRADEPEPQGSDLSRADVADPQPRAPAGS
jgi:hypothetical protein